MNLNAETHFSEVPSVEMPRSTMDLSHGHTLTCNVGDLIPIDFMEIYPGDTVKMMTNKVIRLQTMISPFFGTLYADIRHFFVPNRLVADHWQGVMGENLTGPWAPNVEYTTPKMIYDPKRVGPGTIVDHFGLPVLGSNNNKETKAGGSNLLYINALPIRAYHLIYDTFYRDENLQQPLNIYKGDANREFSPLDSDKLNEQYIYPRKASKMHDYFTSCLPAPLKAENPVVIPMSGRLPVVTGVKHDQETPISLQWQSQPSFADPVYSFDNNNLVGLTTNAETQNPVYPTNLWAEQLAGVADSRQGLVATINDLRTAFQVQRMLERDAYGGSRYCETLRAHFGIVAQDSRLQRPEYLGGNRIPLNVHQVVNNSESQEYKLGNLGAMSHTVDVHEDFTHSFVEHGFIISLMCIRWFPSYAYGMERVWSRTDRYSYYWPALAHLGNMAVLNKEIYADGSTNDDEVFGYQEAWADLRMRPNIVSGMLRPQANTGLDSWTLADEYSECPRLSAEWIEQNKEPVDRNLAVTSTTSDQVLADFWFNVTATRVMPLYSVPGLVDHF